jgi:hypothetical protein
VKQQLYWVKLGEHFGKQRRRIAPTAAIAATTPATLWKLDPDQKFQ